MSDTYIDVHGVMRPVIDQKLLQVDVAVTDLHFAVKYCRRRGLAIQAGGAVGLWPLELSKLFDKVHTWEPHPVNFECLEYNLRGATNVVATRTALGRAKGWAHIRLDQFERNNCGAYYTEPADVADASEISAQQNVLVQALDDWYFPTVDLLQLDVEGRELDVLRGAARLIAKHKPVVMLEAKQLPHMDRWHVDKDDAIKHLRACGYRLVDEIKRDKILVHESQL